MCDKSNNRMKNIFRWAIEKLKLQFHFVIAGNLSLNASDKLRAGEREFIEMKLYNWGLSAFNCLPQTKLIQDT